MAGRRDVAEEIAAVVAAVRAGRFQVPAGLPQPLVEKLAGRVRQDQPVVDATGVYRGLQERVVAGVNLYHDFPSVVSPWDQALVCYVNTHGNVFVMQTNRVDWPAELRWETANPVDWGRLRWLVEVVIWCGGRTGGGRPMPATGPMHVMQHAVYGDGSPGDLHYQILIPDQFSEELWEMPVLVLNAAFNFLSCSNIEVAEPRRPFPVRQRLRQQRVAVQTIVVRPPGRRTRHANSLGRDLRPIDDLDEPLTSVRGGFRHYGPQYDAGLLFGKLAGKFWTRPHTRGAKTGDEPAAVRDYVLHPGAHQLAGGGDG